MRSRKYSDSLNPVYLIARVKTVGVEVHDVVALLPQPVELVDEFFTVNKWEG